MQINSRDYMGTVIKLELTDRFAAAFCDGSVTVHEIEPSSGDKECEWQVPGKGHQGVADAAVTAMGLTSHFLVTGTSRGTITYYILADGSVVNEFRHDDAGIARLFPQPEGTRLVFEDDTHAVLLYNPVNDQALTPSALGVVPFCAAVLVFRCVFTASIQLSLPHLPLLYNFCFCYRYVVVVSDDNADITAAVCAAADAADADTDAGDYDKKE